MIKNNLGLVTLLIENEKELLKYIRNVHGGDGPSGLVTTNLFSMDLKTKGRTTKDSSFPVIEIHMGFHYDRFRRMPKAFFLSIRKDRIWAEHLRMKSGDNVIIGKNYLSFSGKKLIGNEIRLDIRLGKNQKQQILEAVRFICSAIKIELEEIVIPPKAAS